MTMTVSVRVQSTKGATGQSGHDLREGKQPDYVNGERSHLNSEIIRPLKTAEIKKICEQLRFEVGGKKRKMKSSSAVARRGVITFGGEAQPVMGAMTPAQQDKIFFEIAGAMAEKYGAELTGLVVHRDEAALHAHFQLPAIGNDGQPLSMRHIDYSELQDIAGEITEKYGISRGKPKAERMAEGQASHQYIHRSVKELHHDLPKDLERKKIEIKTQAQAEVKKANIAVKAKITEIKEKATSDLKRDLKAKVASIDETVKAYASKAPMPSPTTITAEIKDVSDEPLFSRLKSKLGFKIYGDFDVYPVQEMKQWAKKSAAIDVAAADAKKHKEALEKAEDRVEELLMTNRVDKLDLNDELREMRGERTKLQTQMSNVDTYLKQRGSSVKEASKEGEKENRATRSRGPEMSR